MRSSVSIRRAVAVGDRPIDFVDGGIESFGWIDREWNSFFMNPIVKSGVPGNWTMHGLLLLLFQLKII
jgi:hypothetical protein